MADDLSPGSKTHVKFELAVSIDSYAFISRHVSFGQWSNLLARQRLG